MPLTVKEKEHWREQIEKRINKAIEQVYRLEGKEWRELVTKDTEARVLKRLGLDAYMDRHKELKSQISKLEQQQKDLADEAVKRIEHERHGGYYSESHSVILKVVDAEKRLVKKEVLQESEVGRKILRLEREREELTDTIWLATSPVQIRSLWKDFTAMVTEEPTELQKQAMTYAPVESE